MVHVPSLETLCHSRAAHPYTGGPLLRNGTSSVIRRHAGSDAPPLCSVSCSKYLTFFLNPPHQALPKLLRAPFFLFTPLFSTSFTITPLTRSPPPSLLPDPSTLSRFRICPIDSLPMTGTPAAGEGFVLIHRLPCRAFLSPRFVRASGSGPLTE